MIGMRVTDGLASLRTRAVVAQALLALFLLANLLVMLAALTMAWREIRSGYTLYLFTPPIFALFIALALLPAALSLSFWAWRGHANLAADHLTGLKYGALKAALAPWIPLANLALPKAAMRELWNRSHGEEEWFSQQSVDAINSWWTSYVIGIVILTLLTAMVLIDRFSNLAFLTPPGTNLLALAFSSGLLAASTWFLIRIIARITTAQETVTTVGDTFA